MLHDKLKTFKVILASQSPRRKTLLEGLDINFTVFVKDGIDETYPENLKKEDTPLFLANKKAQEYKDIISENTIIITADTLVFINNEILEKPTDTNDAQRILKKLSGSMHEVITGVAITSKEKQRTFSSATKVWFRELSDTEIDYYIANYKPFDKAGAYGIQEWLGYAAIERIEGSFYNVMGLPVQALYVELEKFIKNINK